ncbi:hypothetical protein AAZX31_09G137500 [Glycine max]
MYQNILSPSHMHEMLNQLTFVINQGEIQQEYVYEEKNQNAPFNIYHTERGGEVTYHGPGQMDLHWYLRTLEEVVIHVLASSFSIQASRLEGLTGNEKLVVVGIRVSHWITYHGLALNVTTNLCLFKWIVPCGIHGHGHQVGSIKGLVREGKLCINHGTDLHHLDDASLIHITYKSLIEEFSQAFQLEYCYKNISAAMLYERKHCSLTK